MGYSVSPEKIPVARFRKVPVYPLELFRAGTTGEAKIEFTVDTEGNVRDVSILYATKQEFGLTSAKTMLSWKFRPGAQEGKPVSVRMVQVFVFTGKEVQIASTTLADSGQKEPEPNKK